MTEPVLAHDGNSGDLEAERAKVRRSRGLFRLGLLGVGLLLAYYAFTSEVTDPIHLYEGLLMLTLAALPSLLWARHGGDQLPVFEVLMLTTASAYALPFLNGQQQLLSFPPEVVTLGGVIVLFYQVVAICTYQLVRGRPGRTSFFTQELLTQSMKKYIGYGLVLSTVYTYVSVFNPDAIPVGINSVLRAVFSGIALVTTFVQSRRWGQGELSAMERAGLIFLLLTQIVIQFSTLLLVGGIAVVVLGMVGYVAGGRRVPVIPAVIIFAVIALLHNGKGAMRAKYWDEFGNHEQVEATKLVPFFSEWIEKGLVVRGDDETQGMSKKLLERTSLMHIICLVAYYSPDRQPFLDGKTYAQIPGQFVPSFFWAGKPPGHISTYTLSIYYGLQSEEGTQVTTIGFGMLAEAYANFGFFGVGLLGFLLGAAYKKVHLATSRSPIFSYAGLYLVILMAWSFQTEWPVSMWLSSMYQACVGVMGMPFILRNFIGD